MFMYIESRPWFARLLSITAYSGLFVATRPPTPVVTMCATYVEKQEMSPNEPTGLPLYPTNIVSHESSIIFSLCFFTMLIIASISHASPNWWTIIMPFVRGVIFSSIFFASML